MAAQGNGRALACLAVLAAVLAWLGCLEVPLPRWAGTEAYAAGGVGTGDLLLFRTGRQDFRWSSAITRVVISHVGIAISAKDAWRDFGHPAPLVLECHARCQSVFPDLLHGGRRAGVQLHALEHRLDEYAHLGGAVAVRRLVGPPLRIRRADIPEQAAFPSDWDMARSGGTQMLNDCYGLRMPAKRLHMDFCSPFVARMYRTLRVLARCAMPEGLVYPDQFYDATGGCGTDARLVLAPAYHFGPAVRLLQHPLQP